MDIKRKSSFSYAAAPLKHNPLCILDDHSVQEEYPPQCVSDPSTYCTIAAGVLTYNRESDNHRLNLTTILPVSQPPIEFPVKCEHCGKQATPSLDTTWIQELEKTPTFCCLQRQQLCETLLKQRVLFGGRWRHRNQTSVKDTPAKQTDEVLVQGRELKDHKKFVMDLSSGLGTQSEQRTYKDYSINLQAAATFSSSSQALIFQLSCAPAKGFWTVHSSSTTENCLKIKEEEEQVSLPFCDHEPIHFGICHHQKESGFLQKYYSDGVRFLTVFPDGSAEVFYPSGHLALIVVVTERNGRVCIVYDDSGAPKQPIRAVFQSDGRAACYHSNGNIWLVVNKSGGQCLNDAGARTCGWSWGSLSVTPTPLHPIFLSLNKAIGVRVLGNKQVFVSFLARGQQAKLSVGACCAQCEYKTPTSRSSASKEELLVSAAKIRINQAVQHLHQNLMKTSHHQPPTTTVAPRLQAAAQRILDNSADVVMSESDRAFIHRCLKDCLMCLQ
ncbi:glutamate-rich protein 6 isoform X2 [Amphiprion ocellaris]|uniref:glutamate-rich protein 6 isoform X2 n=1 Tax=Amphiprion ocellaris TaxID=80972 RepID=UPI00241133FF|nr:glutamate-rich protein 6 isoform X2 [Amphiprion ocellaris]